MNDGIFIASRVGTLHVRQTGSGPTAVLWHSLFVDSASWRRVEPRLSEDRRLILSPATRERDPEAVDYVHSQLGGADRRLLHNAVVSISLGREDFTGLLPDIRVPTLFVTGADHSGLTPEQARESIALVSGGRLAIVPDAAYLAPLEQPEETARVVKEFWAATLG